MSFHSTYHIIKKVSLKFQPLGNVGPIRIFFNPIWLQVYPRAMDIIRDIGVVECRDFHFFGIQN